MLVAAASVFSERLFDEWILGFRVYRVLVFGVAARIGNPCSSICLLMGIMCSPDRILIRAFRALVDAQILNRCSSVCVLMATVGLFSKPHIDEQV